MIKCGLSYMSKAIVYVTPIPHGLTTLSGIPPPLFMIPIVHLSYMAIYVAVNSTPKNWAGPYQSGEVFLDPTWSLWPIPNGTHFFWERTRV